eukprot:7260119-Prymnesium_polylepis.1
MPTHAPPPSKPLPSAAPAPAPRARCRMRRQGSKRPALLCALSAPRITTRALDHSARELLNAPSGCRAQTLHKLSKHALRVRCELRATDHTAGRGAGSAHRAADDADAGHAGRRRAGHRRLQGKCRANRGARRRGAAHPRAGRLAPHLVVPLALRGAGAGHPQHRGPPARRRHRALAWPRQHPSQDARVRRERPAAPLQR